MPIESWYSPETPAVGTRWRLATAADGQPGRSEVLEVQAGDRMIYVLGDAPGSAGLDPDVAGMIKFVIDEVRIGRTDG